MSIFRIWEASFKHFGPWLVCLFAWCAGPFMAGAAETNTPLDQLNKTFGEAHRRYLAETGSVEAAWQFSRACFDLADTASNNTQRAEFANRGIDAGKRGVSLNNNSAPAHYYLGMNIAQLAETRHSLSGLRLVKDMEREFITSRLLDEPFDYAGADRNLGLLYEQAPAIVSIGNRTKARQHLLKAVELAPDFPENQLNLIEAYLKWNYRAEAARQLEKLEKLWPDAQGKFTGGQWALSWPDWNKRLDNMKKRLEGNSKITESPHAAP
jgi:tetratricopeptide (TPR) repeat protein